MEEPDSNSRSNSQGSLSIAVAATFTAAPLQRPLQFWMEMLDVPADIQLAPYGQVMQELLNPQSLFGRNRNGFNILLLRCEDWLRDQPADGDIAECLSSVRRNADDIVAAVGAFRAAAPVPLLVFFCRSSLSTPVAHHLLLEESQHDVSARIGGIGGVRCMTHSELVRLYPVVTCEDSRADRIAHIPYTNDYYLALATFLARDIAAHVTTQYKVIVVDCDNTLWGGICGEDDAVGVTLTPAHLKFQELLVRQHDAGVLLCLCSKNNAADVEAVFRTRPEMVLRYEHISASRINWSAKSSNLVSLAQELGLALDSFVFIDDSPLECTEVQTHCPVVLTLRFPVNPGDIGHFLDHVWVFDRVMVTEEAKSRAAQYKQNRVREAALARAPSLAEFLDSLELKVEVSPMHADHLDRVAELLQRTNQFNLTTIRRRAPEIQTLRDSDALRGLVVHVRDRFGDYGLVGVVFYRVEQRAVDVDSFVLSCRALGRGVEHRIVNELGLIGRREGLSSVMLRYRPTPRNRPAFEFLERSFAHFGSRTSNRKNTPDDEDTFAIPVDYAASLSVGPPMSVAGMTHATTDVPRVIAPPQTWAGRRHETAYRLSRMPDIMRAINRWLPQGGQRAGEYLAPRTQTEVVVANIWAEVLRRDRVGAHDDFFDLGGDSLLAVQAIAMLGSAFGLEVSLFDLLEGSTVEKIAQRITGASPAFTPVFEEGVI